MMDGATVKAGLALLREPFPPHQISKLPKPTKKQVEEVRQDFRKGIRCAICGGWHHPDVVHLDYVGHAALTDRLLDCDPEWNWRPLARHENGLPVLDGNGGLWIELTVCGLTRLGYGHADGKTGGDAIKEAIGDALRNAAMRFGAALDLWHKGNLHVDDTDPADNAPGVKHEPTPGTARDPDKIADAMIAKVRSASTLEELTAIRQSPKFRQALEFLGLAAPDRYGDVLSAIAARENELEAMRDAAGEG